MGCSLHIILNISRLPVKAASAAAPYPLHVHLLGFSGFFPQFSSVLVAKKIAVSPLDPGVLWVPQVEAEATQTVLWLASEPTPCHAHGRWQAFSDSFPHFSLDSSAQLAQLAQARFHLLKQLIQFVSVAS